MADEPQVNEMRVSVQVVGDKDEVIAAAHKLVGRLSHFQIKAANVACDDREDVDLLVDVPPEPVSDGNEPPVPAEAPRGVWGRLTGRA